MRKAAIQRVLSSNSQLWRNSKATAAPFSSNSTSISDKNKVHIGIDVGSSSTKVAIIDGNNQPKLLDKDPSFLYDVVNGKINRNYECLFGFKNLIKRNYNDPLVKKEMERAATNKIIQATNGDAMIESLNGVVFSPTALYQTLLERVKMNTEKFLGKSVSRAVIAYPASFGNDQLKDVVKAGLGAGFELIHSIDEPTAAAIAYGMNGKEEGRRFVVIDIGGRTFDVTIFEVSSNGRFSFKKPTKSDMFFGGNDFDRVIAEYINRVVSTTFTDDERKALEKKEDKEILKLHQDVVLLSEPYKIELSSSFESTIKMPRIRSDGEFVGYFMNETLTRTKFESMVNHLFERIKNQVENCLIEAGISAKDVDEVLLVGGMARVPKVRKVITAIFGKIPNRNLTNPDEAVALGAAAAVQAGHFGIDAWNDQ